MKASSRRSGRASGPREFAITLFRLLLAYRTGAMRYAVLTATKATD